jgi:predicted NAD/FAD-dependent oxidoreductase
MGPMRAAIIGAGMCGLTAATILRNEGIDVQVVEKARGVGGRSSTRREQDFHFDHGAQYFTVRDGRFRSWAERWRRAGIVEVWDAEIVVLEAGRWRPSESHVDRWVGVPGMNAMARELGASLPVEVRRRVTRLERLRVGWRLHADDEAEGPASAWDSDVVLVTTPGPQAVPLLDASPELQSTAQAIQLTPTWAVLVAFPERLDLPFGGAFVLGSPLSWVARNPSKPGRTDQECWVLHGSPEWSARQVGSPPDLVVRTLVEAFFLSARLPPVEPVFGQAHRWLFAQPTGGRNLECLWDSQRGIGAGGDWCYEDGRLEKAFLSGWSLAQRVLEDAKRSS